MSKTLQERFDDKYTPEPNTGCWLWFGKERGGYGRIWSDGLLKGAHRVSYELHNGDIPDGMEVTHTCDCTHCVNPDHLVVGDHAFNMADMATKGRAANKKGENNGRTNITEADVIAIRADSRSQRKIAAAYKISKGAVYYIQQRLTWKHI